jgi:CheY-like chemotaxis protein
MARRALPDLMIVEQTLSGIDGWSLIKMLRADRPTADIPVIFLVSHVPDDAARAEIEDVCVAWHLKPCAPGRMLESVRNCLSRLVLA